MDHIKIGIEVHIKPKCAYKLFCSCKVVNSSQINTDFCPICIGEPGTYPILNKDAVNLSILAAKLLNMTLSEYIKFVRKHYMFRDLPKGYQITMTNDPVGTNGHIYCKGTKIPIERLILEEDPCSYKNGILDYNRSGTPLFEIVTPPCFNDQKEVVEFIKSIVYLFKYADLIDASNKKVFRADINISVNNNPRVEIKNVGSLDQIEKVIPLEINRQKNQPDNLQNVRCYDPLLSTTVFMRYKEHSSEYLYLLEPNITPIATKNYTDIPYNIYYMYDELCKMYGLKPVLKAISKNSQLTNYVLKNNVNLRVLELMIKYKNVDYNILAKNMSVDMYQTYVLSKLYNPYVDFKLAYNELLKDAKFMAYCKPEYVSKPPFAYVIGQLKKRTHLTYGRIIKELNTLWNGTNNN